MLLSPWNGNLRGSHKHLARTLPWHRASSLSRLYNKIEDHQQTRRSILLQKSVLIILHEFFFLNTSRPAYPGIIFNRYSVIHYINSNFLFIEIITICEVSRQCKVLSTITNKLIFIHQEFRNVKTI